MLAIILLNTLLMHPVFLKILSQFLTSCMVKQILYFLFFFKVQLGMQDQFYVMNIKQ